MNTEMKHFPITAQIKVDLTQEDIDDIMCSALEGGINYWCGKAEVVEEKRRDKWGHKQIARDGTLILHDVESDDTWELTLEKFTQGFMKYLEAGNMECIDGGKVDTCQIDADAADSIVQYALFGELVFG